MANDNQIDFTVRIKREGVGELASDLAKVEDRANDLGAAATAAGAGLDKLGDATSQAGTGLDQLAASEGKAEASSTDLGSSAANAAQKVDEVGQAASQAGSGLQQLAATEGQAAQQANDLKAGSGAAGQAVTTLGAQAQQAKEAVSGLSSAESQAEAQARELGAGAQAASKSVADVGQASDKAGSELEALANAADAKTRAIRAGLQAEQSEIELQRQHLVLAREEQQGRLQSARSRGDEAAATQAQNRLRQIESDQLALTARGLRAEANAVLEVAQARREQLSALGPLTRLQTQELQAAENSARALRVQSAASDQAAQRARELGSATQAAVAAQEDMGGQLAEATRLLSRFAAGLGIALSVEEVGQIADEFNNLQSRIKLVTGEGDNFKRSWQGVSEVALRTHSALEETGVLFTRLAQAGKDAGLSAAQASAQSLALTETINQAIQLSGASAQASSAAITQLVQGLQGGALRGDEFNSVMEQSPRLARALADGLGVTTGELRKMAEAGLLTSDTVIKALQGQSQTVATEFSKLPPTVGRALQDLSTQWTLYIGETDKATGASAAAATAINAMANNLRTIAGLLIDVGQAAAAFTALRLAQQFLGIGAAAQASATAIAATNAQMAAAGPAAATAAAGAGRLVTMLATLRTFTLVGLIANIKDVGTWLGESAAKLAGFKDRTDELVRAEKLQAEIAKEAAADRLRLATAIQAAIDRTFDLSKAARSAVAEFEQLTKDGKSVAEAMKKATDAFDLTKVQGIRDFSATLEKLSATGKITATELQAAWAQALDGKDLADFEVKARLAFAAARTEATKAAAAVQAALARGVSGEELTALQSKAEAAFAVLTRESQRTAQLMDGLLREAVKRTGLEYEQLQGHIGAASRSAINDVEAIVAGMGRLKAEGVDTSRVLVASLSRAINTADGQAAIDNLRGRIEQMRKVLGDKITDGLLDQAREKANALKDALDQATPGINSVREALKQLGVTSDESLKKTATDAKEAYDTLTASGTASARELGEGFRRAAEAAIAANKGIAPAWVEGQAALRGYRVVTDEAGKASLELAGAVDRSTSSMRSAASAASSGAAAVSALGDAYTDAGAKAFAAQGQFLAAAQAQRSANTSASSISNRPQSENQFAWTRLAIMDWLKQAGLDEETARQVSAEFVDASGNVPYSNNAGQIKYGGRNSTMTQALYKAVEQYKFKGAAAPAPSPAPTPAPSPSPGGGGTGGGNTFVNNITINGVGDWGVVRGTTRHRDAASANTEVELLRKLAQAQGASI